MSLDLNDFKARLLGGGSRANLFRVIVTNPPGGIINVPTDAFSFMCRSAQMPASTFSVVEVNFRGRVLKLSGDRTFEPWSPVIYNDVDMTIRKALESWSAYIQNHRTNNGEARPNAYKADLTVEHLSKDEQVTHRYKFFGAFPTSIASIELSYDPATAIEEFSCEFNYDYWETFETQSRGPSEGRDGDLTSTGITISGT